MRQMHSFKEEDYFGKQKSPECSSDWSHFRPEHFSADENTMDTDFSMMNPDSITCSSFVEGLKTENNDSSRENLDGKMESFEVIDNLSLNISDSLDGDAKIDPENALIGPENALIGPENAFKIQQMAAVAGILAENPEVLAKEAAELIKKDVGIEQDDIMGPLVCENAEEIDENMEKDDESLRKVDEDVGKVDEIVGKDDYALQKVEENVDGVLEDLLKNSDDVLMMKSSGVSSGDFSALIIPENTKESDDGNLVQVEENEKSSVV